MVCVGEERELASEIERESSGDGFSSGDRERELRRRRDREHCVYAGDRKRELGSRSRESWRRKLSASMEVSLRQ